MQLDFSGLTAHVSKPVARSLGAALAKKIAAAGLTCAGVGAVTVFADGHPGVAFRLELASGKQVAFSLARGSSWRRGGVSGALLELTPCCFALPTHIEGPTFLTGFRGCSSCREAVEEGLEFFFDASKGLPEHLTGALETAVAPELARDPLTAQLEAQEWVQLLALLAPAAREILFYSTRHSAREASLQGREKLEPRRHARQGARAS